MAGWDGKGSTTQWRKTRAAILDRDGHTCQLTLPGCTTTATQVDHIIRLSDGGMKYEPVNLRADCKHCNLAREHNPPITPYTNTRW